MANKLTFSEEVKNVAKRFFQNYLDLVMARVQIDQDVRLQWVDLKRDETSFIERNNKVNTAEAI